MSQAGSFSVGPTASNAINSFVPNQVLLLSDDFTGVEQQGGSSWAASDMAWFISSAFNQTGLGDSAHPGILGSPSFAAGDIGLFLNPNVGASFSPQFILGGGSITLNWVIKIATLSDNTNTYTLRVGLGDTGNADEVNGTYFEYSNGTNSGKWVYKTASASTRTTSNSTVTVATGWHNLQITINAAASSVSYFVDGVSLGTAISTNIPTAAITPFVDIVRSAGTIPANSILIDLFYMSQVLTTAR